jgi:hypothetical protein
MKDIQSLRTAVIGLLSFAGAEEEALLATVATAEPEQGTPQRWAAVPLVAHSTEFKRQQVQRLEAIRLGEAPPGFAEIDHSSEEIYTRYCEQTGDLVREASRATTQALVDGVSATSDEDLVDPSRHRWLAGRKLWLQIIVRGFWHPTGHLGEYCLEHGQAAGALALQARAVALSADLSAPEAARGMALYNLACAQARAELANDALSSLSEAIGLNSDLRANAGRDRDLLSLRGDGRLDALLGSR